MTAIDELRKLMDPQSSSKWLHWYKKQILVVRALRAGQTDKVGTRAALDSPEPDEIISETIVRVLDQHNSRYVWDGKTPSNFNQFFARCLKTSINGLRAQERRHRLGPQRLEIKTGALTQLIDEPTVQSENLLANSQAKTVLATVIAGTRMRGAALRPA